ncbi:MAG: glycosyltransferase family 4 protein [Thermoanaerobaculia bacterium]
MNVTMFTPLPPTRTGIAHYAAMLIPALREKVELEAVSEPVDPATRQTGNPIYQLGNNPHHEWIYREAMKKPGVIVLHDIVLHHLIVQMTLARGDAEGYIAAMQANHGDMGAAWARGRIIGLHTELANFLMPASIDVANRSRAVIVHNRYAADRLRSLGVTTPIHVVPHPHIPSGPTRDRAGLRRRLGISDDERVIGFFGFLTSAKRAEVVLEAFQIARERNRKLRLLVVGEAAPNIEAIGGVGITVTGYVDDAEFDDYYAAADRLVNLRYPSAGETSGTLLRAFDAGKPVAVSDYAQFAELPDDVATKIAFGPDEVKHLAEFFLRDIASPAAAQRRWLEENASMERAVAGYMAALSNAPLIRPSAAFFPHGGEKDTRLGLSLFPRVSLSWNGTSLILRNDGDTVLRAGEYGQPGYRAVLKFGDRDRWVALPRDLAPGEGVAIDAPAGAQRVTLTHALEGIPIVDETPAAVVELRRVR